GGCVRGCCGGRRGGRRGGGRVGGGGGGWRLGGRGGGCRGCRGCCGGWRLSARGGARRGRGGGSRGRGGRVSGGGRGGHRGGGWRNDRRCGHASIAAICPATGAASGRALPALGPRTHEHLACESSARAAGTAGGAVSEGGRPVSACVRETVQLLRSTRLPAVTACAIALRG